MTSFRSAVGFHGLLLGAALVSGYESTAFADPPVAAAPVVQPLAPASTPPVPQAAPAPPPPATAPAPPPANAVAPPPGSPPPGYAPPPGSPPPGYAPPPNSPPPGAYPGYPYPYPAQQFPRTLPYEEGQPVPPGYRLESGIRRGPVIAGSIVLGVPWALGVSVAGENNFSNRSGWLVIPALGPWITLAARDNCTNDVNSYCNDDGVRGILIFDGLAQTAGATLLILGIALPRTQLVRADVATLELVPMLGPAQTGVAALGTF